MKESISNQIENNKTKTWVIIVFFAILITTLVYIFSSFSGNNWSYTFIALLFSSLFSFSSYFWSDKIILSISQAHPADPNKDADFYHAVENIVTLANLPNPKLYVIEDSSPNAFATGRDPGHAVICVTRGLLEKLSNQELRGVIAHEMSHIKNFDIRLMAIVAVLTGMVVIISDQAMRIFWFGRGNNDQERNQGMLFVIIGILLSLLSPVIATIVQLSISRKREYLADASGVLMTGLPLDLAHALEKIAGDRVILKTRSNAMSHLYICNPFKNKSGGSWFSGLFNTHPPVEERIKILKSMY